MYMGGKYVLLAITVLDRKKTCSWFLVQIENYILENIFKDAFAMLEKFLLKKRQHNILNQGRHIRYLNLCKMQPRQLRFLFLFDKTFKLKIDQKGKRASFLWGKFSIFYWIGRLASAFQLISPGLNPTLSTLQMPLPLQSRRWLKEITCMGLLVSLQILDHKPQMGHQCCTNFTTSFWFCSFCHCPT